MKHTYELTIRFTSERATKLHDLALIQWDNGLSHFVGLPYDNEIIGPNNASLKKLTAKKRSTARKHKRKKKTVKKPRIYKLWGDSVVY